MTARSALARCLEACNRPMSAFEMAEWLAANEGGAVATLVNTVGAAFRVGNPHALGQKIKRRNRAMTATDKSRFEYYIDSHNPAKPKSIEQLATQNDSVAGLLDDLVGASETHAIAPAPTPTKPRITIDELNGSVVIETSGLIIEVRRGNDSP